MYTNSRHKHCRADGKIKMVQLTDYLYSGDTVIHILHKYATALQREADEENDPVDAAHASFLLGMLDMLEHNDFLTSQSQRIREFYKYMAQKYPYLAFTLRGRIKSLIRMEEKFNGYIVSCCRSVYAATGSFPTVEELLREEERFRDLIAYRIVISMPACHLKKGSDRAEVEKKLIYEIANALPGFLSEREFRPEKVFNRQKRYSSLLHKDVRPFYRDYVEHPTASGYRALHIAFYDEQAKSNLEMQIRTKDMDDFAEIGDANHAVYEQNQEKERTGGQSDLRGMNACFDKALTRVENLQKLELSKIDVNMFRAMDNYRINDGCGLYYGRQILPYEHLSRFQNDEIG